MRYKSLRCTRRFLIVLPPLKYISTPCFLQIFLQLSPIPCIYGMTIYGLLLLPLLLAVLIVPWLVLSFLFCLMLALVRAHSGYLHHLRVSLRWSSSSFSRCLLEQTVLALCFKVLITLNLAARWWWLFHYKYWSVCVGFLYTDVNREPSSCGITIVSRKGMDPSVLASSVVKWMCGSTLLMCSGNLACFQPQWPQKHHPQTSSKLLEGTQLCWWSCSQNPPCRGWPQWGWWATP